MGAGKAILPPATNHILKQLKLKKMETLKIIEDTIKYRDLFQKESETYKQATVTISFLVTTFLINKLWVHYDEIIKEAKSFTNPYKNR